MSPGSPRWSLLALLAPSVLAATAAFAAPTHTQSTGKVYRWVDDQGVVHYGDQIPPQYASRERTLLNSQGVPVGQLDAQKSPEQLAAEERDRLALIKQKQHDSFLMTTYTSVADIEALRDARLDQLRTQRAAGQQYIESLRSRLGALQTRALTFRPYSARPTARRMPDDLAEDLVRTMNELNQQSAALAATGETETQLRAQFQADIERYRALHTVHTDRQ